MIATRSACIDNTETSAGGGAAGAAGAFFLQPDGSQARSVAVTTMLLADNAEEMKREQRRLHFMDGKERTFLNFSKPCGEFTEEMIELRKILGIELAHEVDDC